MKPIWTVERLKVWTVAPGGTLPAWLSLAGLTKRKGATWIKAGLVARVRHLRGEDKLRHATLQTLDPKEPLPGEVDVNRQAKDE